MTPQANRINLSGLSRPSTPLASLLAITLISACGGGGGGTLMPSAAPTIAATPIVAAPGPVPAPSPAPVPAPAPVPNPVPVPAPGTLSLTPVETQVLAGRSFQALSYATVGSQYADLASTQINQILPSSSVLPCPTAGNLVIGRNDADRNGRFSAGDSLSITGNNCTGSSSSDSGGTTIISGSVLTQVLALTGSAYSSVGTWILRAQQSFTNFSTTYAGATSVLSGGLLLEDSNGGNAYIFDNLTVRNPSTGLSLQLRSGGLTVRSATATSSSSLTFNNLVFDTDLSAAKRVTVTATQGATAFALNPSTNQYTAGVLNLSVGIARITFTVIAPSQVRLDTDLNGDGTVDSTQTVAISSLTQLSGL